MAGKEKEKEKKTTNERYHHYPITIPLCRVATKKAN